MSCNRCLKRKRNIKNVRKIASIYSRIVKNDIQIYSKDSEVGTIYEFEIEDSNRVNVKEIIKWQELEQKI